MRLTPEEAIAHFETLRPVFLSELTLNLKKCQKHLKSSGDSRYEGSVVLIHSLITRGLKKLKTMHLSRLLMYIKKNSVMSRMSEGDNKAVQGLLDEIARFIDPKE